NGFIYVSDGKHFTLISPGPDGEEGTEDDIKVKK
ncbi:MAG: type II secretion system protein GspG, partial [Desulfurobacterium sp.]